MYSEEELDPPVQSIYRTYKRNVNKVNFYLTKIAAMEQTIPNNINKFPIS